MPTPNFREPSTEQTLSINERVLTNNNEESGELNSQNNLQNRYVPGNVGNPPVQLTFDDSDRPNSNDRRNPAGEALGNGNVVFAHTSNDDIYAFITDANGVRLPITFTSVRVNTLTTGIQDNVSIKILPNGICFTWKSNLNDGNGYDIYTRTLDFNLDPLPGDVGETRVNQNIPGDQIDPSTALNGNHLTFTWNDKGNSTTPNRIVNRVMDTTTGNFTSENQVNTLNGILETPDTTVRNSGTNLATWSINGTKIAVTETNAVSGLRLRNDVIAADTQNGQNGNVRNPSAACEDNGNGNCGVAFDSLSGTNKTIIDPSFQVSNSVAQGVSGSTVGSNSNLAYSPETRDFSLLTNAVDLGANFFSYAQNFFSNGTNKQQVVQISATGSPSPQNPKHVRKNGGLVGAIYSITSIRTHLWMTPFKNLTLPTTATPTTAVQTTAVQTTATPTTAVPTTAIPTTAVATTAIPTTAVQTTAVQTTAVQTTALPTTAKETTSALTTEIATTQRATTVDPTTSPASTGQTNVPPTSGTSNQVTTYNPFNNTRGTTSFENSTPANSSSAGGAILLSMVLGIGGGTFFLALYFAILAYVLYRKQKDKSKKRVKELAKNESDSENSTDVELKEIESAKMNFEKWLGDELYNKEFKFNNKRTKAEFIEKLKEILLISDFGLIVDNNIFSEYELKEIKRLIKFTKREFFSNKNVISLEDISKIFENKKQLLSFLKKDDASINAELNKIQVLTERFKNATSEDEKEKIKTSLKETINNLEKKNENNAKDYHKTELPKIIGEKIPEISSKIGRIITLKNGIEVRLTEVFLGKGNFGVVMLGQRCDNNEFVAVKIICDEKSFDSELACLELINNIDNKNVLSMDGYTIDEDYVVGIDNKEENPQKKLYIVSRYLTSGNGQALQKKDFWKKYTFDQRCQRLGRILKDLLFGFRDLHRNRVYHLDFKTDNFMLNEEIIGEKEIRIEAVIGDLGCAQRSENGQIHGENGDSTKFSKKRWAYRYNLYKKYNKGRFYSDGSLDDPQNPSAEEKEVLFNLTADSTYQLEYFDAGLSDIWQIGLAIWELITGENPFENGVDDCPGFIQLHEQRENKELRLYHTHLINGTEEFFDNIFKAMEKKYPWFQNPPNVVIKIMKAFLKEDNSLTLEEALKMLGSEPLPEQELAPKNKNDYTRVVTFWKQEQDAKARQRDNQKNSKEEDDSDIDSASVVKNEEQLMVMVQ